MKIPFSRVMCAGAIPLVLALTGCATTTPYHEHAASFVRGPSGEPANLLACRDDAGTCVQMASNACAFGYVVHGMGVAPPQRGDYSYGRYSGRTLRHTRSFMFISCNADPAEERARARCDDAYGGTESFAAYWSGRRGPAERKRDYPSATELTTTCRALPPLVQHCMQTAYREAHREACDGAVSRLATDDRRKIDALFFERTAVAGD